MPHWIETAFLVCENMLDTFRRKCYILSDIGQRSYEGNLVSANPDRRYQGRQATGHARQKMTICFYCALGSERESQPGYRKPKK